MTRCRRRRTNPLQQQQQQHWLYWSSTSKQASKPASCNGLIHCDRSLRRPAGGDDDDNDDDDQSLVLGSSVLARPRVLVSWCVILRRKAWNYGYNTFFHSCSWVVAAACDTTSCCSFAF
jgi:hypothetical protein